MKKSLTLALIMSFAATFFISIGTGSAAEELRACTMEYMPVCGLDGVTYGNKCMAGNVNIAYQGECNAPQNASSTQVIGMPNPASVNCTKNGGKLDIKTNSDGSQFGLCTFANGKSCEEWAFFRGECKPVITKVKTIKTNTDTLELRVKYPIINISALDADIASTVNKIIAEFGPGEKSEHWKSQLYIDYKTSSFNKRYLSVRFYVYQFTGGAHGSQALLVKNYDLKTKTEIFYSDLFNQDYDYLQAFWRNTEPQLTHVLKKMTKEYDQKWLREGSSPKSINYDTFYLSDKGIIIYFGQYQVAPYSNGTFEVPVPWNKIKSGLRSDFNI